MVSIITFGLVMHSCQMEDDSLSHAENFEYLNITSSYDNLSKSDFFILKLALERVDPYIEENAGRLKLKLSSGETINISDNLFEMIVTTLNKSNGLIQDDLFFIKENKLIPSDQNLSKIIRLKSGYEGDTDDDYTQTKYYWWGTLKLQI